MQVAETIAPDLFSDTLEVKIRISCIADSFIEFIRSHVQDLNNVI